ncbi:MAG: helix-turn-helix transcriptional regulator [Deltaproteobacteria bacterium]
MGSYMNTRELAKYLGINEKKVYSLIEEKGLPGTKVTGKWGFIKELVDIWLENSTENYPSVLHRLKGFLMVAGSNDPLLEFALDEVARGDKGFFPFFCNTGSTEGLLMLKEKKVHIAASHLLDQETGEYNICQAASGLSEHKLVVINFAYRKQGLMVKKGNPKKIMGIEDLAKKGTRFANRQKGAGTRVLMDSLLKKAMIPISAVSGYDNEVSTHLDVALRVLRNEADAGAGIMATANLLGLGFIPLKEERFDLLVPREYFFAEEVAALMDIIRSERFSKEAARFGGYDTRDSGKVIYTC